MPLSRRGFLRRLGVGATGAGTSWLRPLLTATVAAVTSACRHAIQIASRPFILRTELGDVRVWFRDPPRGPLRPGERFDLVLLELPAAALVAPPATTPTQAAGWGFDRRVVFLRDVVAAVEGIAVVHGGEIVPSDGFALLISPQAWFPTAGAYAPVGLDFALTALPLRFRHTGFRYPSVHAEWDRAPFNVRFADRPPGSSSNTKTVARALAFAPDGVGGLRVTVGAVATGGALNCEAFTTPHGAIHIQFPSLSFEGARLTWQPTALTIALPPLRATVVRITDENPLTPASANVDTRTFQIAEATTRHWGLRQCVPTPAAGTGLPAIDDGHLRHENTVLTMEPSQLEGVWPILPAQAIFEDRERDSKLTFRAAEMSPVAFRASVQYDGAHPAQPVTRAIDQTLDDAEIKIDGAGVGGFAAALRLPWAAHRIVHGTMGRHSNETLVMTPEPPPAVEPVAQPPKRGRIDALGVADQWVRADELKHVDLSMTTRWPRAGTLDSGILEAEGPAIGWTGRVRSKGLEWVHVTDVPYQGADPSNNYRADPIELTDHALEWRLDSGRQRWAFRHSTDGTSPAPITDERSRLVALTDEVFRASVRPAFPIERTEAILELPPFTLREHPVKMSAECATPVTGWVCYPPTANEDPACPAFRYAFMWEPRVNAPQAEASSVKELFERAKDLNGPVSLTMAGIAMAADTAKRPEVDWLPNPVKDAVPYIPLRIRDFVATNALDMIPLDSAERAIVTNGLNKERHEIIRKALNDPRVPVALSPVGGAIDFDWKLGRIEAGLVDIGWHTYQQRYQRLTAVAVHIVVPWGLRVQVVTRLFRDRDGEIKYCERWSFIDPKQEYGPIGDVGINNLRPLNADTRKKGDPFLFQADFDFASDQQRIPAKDYTLSGWDAEDRTDRRQSISLDGVPGFDGARSVFGEKVMVLHSVEWTSADATTAQAITVTAHGDVITDDRALSLDDNGVATSWARELLNLNGAWSGTPAVKTEFNARALTLANGFARVNKPLEGASYTKVQATAKFRLTKKIKMSDVQVLQLLTSWIKDDSLDGKEPEGELTIEYSFDSERPLEHSASGRLEFPDLTGLTKAVCERDMKFGLAAQPKKFEGSFETPFGGPPPTFRAEVTADLGVPGILRFKDTKFRVTESDLVPQVTWGTLDVCDGVLKIILEKIVLKLLAMLGGGGGGGGGNNFPFSIKLDLSGLQIGFDLGSQTDIPLGGGTLRNLNFGFRLAINFDFTGSGSQRGLFMAVFLGKMRVPHLEGFQWAGVALVDLGHLLMSRVDALEFQFTPFVARLGLALGFRVLPPAGGLQLERSQFLACLRLDGGISLAFDVGIASGSVSLALTVRYCPTAELTAEGVKYCLSIVAVGIVFDGRASVAGVITVNLHAEIIATLKLGCEKPNEMISHVVFSGSASIEIAWVKVEFHFTVNLDSILGLRSCCLPECEDCAKQVMRLSTPTGRNALLDETRARVAGFLAARGYAA
jgi:hypothetical protein